MDLDGHWLAIFSRWIEFPLAHCRDGFLIQSHPELVLYTNILRLAIITNDQLQQTTPWKPALRASPEYSGSWP